MLAEIGFVLHNPLLGTPIPRSAQRRELGLFVQLAPASSRPRLRNLVCFALHTSHLRLQTSPELGLFVQPARAGPRRQAAAGVPPNWVCLYKTLDIGPQMPEVARVWLCFARFALPGASISRSAYSSMGVSPMIWIHGQDTRATWPNWVCLYKTFETGPQIPQSAQVWLCLFTATCLLATGHAKLGLFVQPHCVPPGAASQLALFVQLSLAPPSELALFGMISLRQPALGRKFEVSSLKQEDAEDCPPGLPDLTLDTLHLKLLQS